MAKRIRKPFVMTIAALAVGCGAKFEMGSASDADVSDTGVISDTGLVDGGPSCPTSSPPSEGSACTTEGAACYYPRCAPPSYQSDINMRCESGIWQRGSEASCNPPPPPSEPCPATEPKVGGTCTRTPYGPACRYADTCPSNPTDYGFNDYTCEGATWRRTSPAYVVSCPTAAPVDGSACECAGHLKTTSCNYGDCGGVATIHAVCNEATKKWSVIESTCNPPPPDFDAGPSDDAAPG